MIKVDFIPTPPISLGLPATKEIWAITRKELAGKGIVMFCADNFGHPPEYIYEDMSLRVFYIGVN